MLQDKLKELQSKLETEESEKNEWVVKHWTSQQDCVKLKQELDKVHELAKEQHFSIEDLGNKNVQLEIDLKTEVDKTKSTPQLLNQEETCLDLKAQGVSSNGPSGDNIPPNHTSLSKNGDSTDFLPGKEHQNTNGSQTPTQPKLLATKKRSDKKRNKDKKTSPRVSARQQLLGCFKSYEAVTEEDDV